MATELVMIRRPDGSFLPYGEGEMAKAARFKVGRLATMTAVLMRSYPYHKRWFALAQFAYSVWTETVEPIQYQGIEVEPSFERFREDLTILAGHYTATYAINGQLRLRAKSISFATMDQAEFEAFYSATINAVMRTILSKGAKVWTEAELRAHIDQLMSFD